MNLRDLARRAGKRRLAAAAVLLLLGGSLVLVRKRVRSRRVMWIVAGGYVLVMLALTVSTVRALRRGEGPDEESRLTFVAGPKESAYRHMQPARSEHPRMLLTPLRRAELQARTRKPTAAWKRLTDFCDQYRGGSVEWHDGNDDAPAPVVTEGYQGEMYFRVLLSEALCFWMRQKSDPERAQENLRIARDVLAKMSEEGGAHAPDPLRNSGYPIRFFGTGMALGYDWLYPELSENERIKVRNAIVRWSNAFAEKGFSHEHPQGNYFAGYYAAKALGALAIMGDDPRGDALWDRWLTWEHGAMVQPYYAKNMAGGGWPEGWQYGAFATINMSLPTLAAFDARGIDLIADHTHPFAFPVDQAKQLVHYTWPSRQTLDDRGDLSVSDNPGAISADMVTFVSGLLSSRKDPFAARFRRYAREVRRFASNEPAPWLGFLFDDEGERDESYDTEQTSYLSTGMNTVAMRSSWQSDAVLGVFTSGPCPNYPASGEMYFDQGALTVTRGGTRLLVNTVPALYEHTPGTNDGENNGDFVYEDLFGDNGADPKARNRTLFNVFYVQSRRFGQVPTEPHVARTKVALFQDSDGTVVAGGRALEDMYYPTGTGDPTTLVKAWSRDVVYVRPSLFVVIDDTEAVNDLRDQWLAFHVTRTPELVRAADGTVRYDIHGRVPTRVVTKAEEGTTERIEPLEVFRGAVTFAMPPSPRVTVVDVNRRGKVFRLEVRAQKRSTKEHWLTVIDASPSREETFAVTRLGDRAFGVLAASSKQVLAVGRSFDSGEIVYEVPAREVKHTWLNMENRVSVSVEKSPNGCRVRIGSGAAKTDLAHFTTTEACTRK